MPYIGHNYQHTATAHGGQAQSQRPDSHAQNFWFDPRLGSWVPRNSGHHQQPQQPAHPQQQYQNPQTSVKISRNEIGVAQPTGEAVQNWTSPQQDVISEQRKRDRDSTEDMPSETQNAEKKHRMTNSTTGSTEDVPPVPQSTEKKPRKTKNAPRKAPAKQLKQTAAKTKATEDGKKALEELEESVNWTNDETRILLEALLGPDSELYTELGTNAKYAYRKVSQTKFDGKRSPQSVRSRYERLRKLFTYILAFESMTGNGEGDPDVKELDEQIKNARVAGRDVGNLSGTMLKRWYTEGWYELFNNRLGEHPGLVREHDFRSGTISDTIEISSDEDAKDANSGFESADAEAKPARKSTAKGGTASTKTQEKSLTSRGVPAPRHKRQSSRTSMGSELAEYLTSNAEYMRHMMKSDNDRLKIQQKRENRQDEKQAADARAAQVEARVRNAREVLADEMMPDDMKEVARKVLMDYFTDKN
ncbi:hypothetical protein EV424DRAFT_1581703 [Suillus variegatus]|nr:hypothetical protein EV424DRAFT_1581703 [Suillus variegatus]